jgi:hypothetical protein
MTLHPSTRRSELAFFQGLLLIAACGAKLDVTTVDVGCSGADTCNDGGPLTLDPAGRGLQTTDEREGDGVGGRPTTVDTPSPAPDLDKPPPSIDTEPRTCPDFAPIASVQLEEARAQAAFSQPIFDEDGNLMPPERQPSPCSECMSLCSVNRMRGCEAQDDCVTRHCACDGCEGRLIEGDFCICAASCMGPEQAACLQPWVDYGECVSVACADVCL